MMDSKMFGEIAMQLLMQSSISGADLDSAIDFRELASKLRSGEMEMSSINKDGENKPRN